MCSISESINKLNNFQKLLNNLKKINNILSENYYKVLSNEVKENENNINLKICKINVEKDIMPKYIMIYLR